MSTRPSLILSFALVFAAFIILPGLLGQPFPPYPLVHWADLLDLFTPLALIPLYWMLFRETSGERATGRGILAFLLLAALWVEGQGMHLSANSISNLLGPGSTAVHDLVHFYDEVLSHYLWHAAIVGLSVLLLLRSSEPAEAAAVGWGRVGPAAVLYGLTYFIAVNEGGTVPLGLPTALVIVAWLLLTRRLLARSHNLVGFLLSGYSLALVLFLVWYLIWGGFPEFSEVGII
jgi:hypothetical protein